MTTYSQTQRVNLVRAYLRELDRVCKHEYDGDWERMPPRLSGLPIKWDRVIRQSRVDTTPAGASQVVKFAIQDDAVMDAV